MKLVSVNLDGKKQAKNAFFALFVAYDEKDDSLSHIEELIGEVDLALGKGKLSKTFSDTKAGISFNYPDWWIVMDNPGTFTVVEMYSSRNSADHKATFEVSESIDIYGVLTERKASVKRSVNEIGTFIDCKDVMLGEIPAKVLSFQPDEMFDGQEEVIIIYIR